MERRLGESALKRDKQADRLQKIMEEMLEKNPDVNIISVVTLTIILARMNRRKPQTWRINRKDEQTD